MVRSLYIFVCCALAVMAVGCGDDATSTDRTSPAEVTDLTAIAVTDTSVTLAWTAPGDDGTIGQASEYDLRFGLTPAPTNLEAAPRADSLAVPRVAGSSEQATVSGLLAEEDYYFALRTADEMENWSLFSPVVIAHTTADTIPPAAVVDLTATAISHRSIQLSWTAPGDSDGEGTAATYEIRYATDPITDETWAEATVVDGVPTPRPAGSSESLDVEDLEDLTTYYFGLKATDDGLNTSALSNVASATTPIDDIPPAAVTDLAVVSVTYSTVTLTWTAPGNDGDLGRAASYDIRYAETPVTEATWDDAQVVLVDITPAEAGAREEVTVRRMEPGRTYFFALIALDERGNASAVSNDPHATVNELFGRVWHVLEDGSGDAPTIQAGIDSASVGDTVLVAQGAYYESIDFKGKGIVVLGAEGPEATIIQGTPGTTVVTFSNGERVHTVLRGLTITGGSRGVLVLDAEPTIVGNCICQNVDGPFGGGIYAGTSKLTTSPWTPRIEGNLIAGNSVSISGGGIYCDNDCTPMIVGNTINSNHAAFGDGGGIYLQPTVSGSLVSGNRITDNTASDKGGGLFVAVISDGLFAELTHNLIVGNRAEGRAQTGFSGGGIALRRVDAWIHHNTLIGNSGLGPTDSYGGAIAIDRDASPIIEQNIIAFTEMGGAIRCVTPATPTIRNNLVWENVGGHGSGACTEWVEEDGNIEANPLFCDPANNDYRVRGDSPALMHPEGPIGAFPTPGCSPPASSSRPR